MMSSAEELPKLRRKLATTEKVIISLLEKPNNQTLVEKKLAIMENLIADIPDDDIQMTEEWNDKVVALWGKLAAVISSLVVVQYVPPTAIEPPPTAKVLSNPSIEAPRNILEIGQVTLQESKWRPTAQSPPRATESWSNAPLPPLQPIAADAVDPRPVAQCDNWNDWGRLSPTAEQLIALKPIVAQSTDITVTSELYAKDYSKIFTQPLSSWSDVPSKTQEKVNAVPAGSPDVTAVTTNGSFDNDTDWGAPPPGTSTEPTKPSGYAAPERKDEKSQQYANSTPTTRASLLNPAEFTPVVNGTPNWGREPKPIPPSHSYVQSHNTCYNGPRNDYQSRPHENRFGNNFRGSFRPRGPYSGGNRYSGPRRWNSPLFPSGKVVIGNAGVDWTSFTADPEEPKEENTAQAQPSKTVAEAASDDTKLVEKLKQLEADIMSQLTVKTVEMKDLEPKITEMLALVVDISGDDQLSLEWNDRMAKIIESYNGEMKDEEPPLLVVTEEKEVKEKITSRSVPDLPLPEPSLSQRLDSAAFELQQLMISPTVQLKQVEEKMVSLEALIATIPADDTELASKFTEVKNFREKLDLFQIFNGNEDELMSPAEPAPLTPVPLTPAQMAPAKNTEVTTVIEHAFSPEDALPEPILAKTESEPVVTPTVTELANLDKLLADLTQFEYEARHLIDQTDPTNINLERAIRTMHNLVSQLSKEGHPWLVNLWVNKVAGLKCEHLNQLRAVKVANLDGILGQLSALEFTVERGLARGGEALVTCEGYLSELEKMMQSIPSKRQDLVAQWIAKVDSLKKTHARLMEAKLANVTSLSTSSGSSEHQRKEYPKEQARTMLKNAFERLYLIRTGHDFERLKPLIVFAVKARKATTSDLHEDILYCTLGRLSTDLQAQFEAEISRGESRRSLTNLLFFLCGRVKEMDPNEEVATFCMRCLTWGTHSQNRCTLYQDNIDGLAVDLAELVA